MPRDRSRSAALRRLAQTLIDQVPDEHLSASRADLVTSLVRQWLTYDGHATLIFGNEQHYLRPVLNPGEEPAFDFHCVAVESWLKRLMLAWDFGDEEFDDIIEQLNIGQSAEFKNRRGELLRLSLNPKERSRTIGSVERGSSIRATEPPDLAEVARRHLHNMFPLIEEREKEDLVASLVRQWSLHDNNALILALKVKYHVVLTVLPEGTKVTSDAMPTALPQQLLACGVPEEALLSFLHALNIGEHIEVTDEYGRRCKVVLDPKTAGVGLQIVPPPSDLSFQVIVGM